MKTMTARVMTLGTALAALLATQADAFALADRGSVLDGMSARAMQEGEEGEDEEFYRNAREAIARGQFDRAAALLDVLRDRFPNTRYAPEALYWQAFSKYRMESLREALTLLESQLTMYPQAKISESSRDLELRIRSLLGSRGDARSAERALREAEQALATTAAVRALRAQERALTTTELAAVRAARAAEPAAMSASERALLMSGSALRRSQLAMEIAAQRSMGGEWQEACEEDDIRHAAIQALMQMDSERAIPLLRTVLARRDECSVPLRKQAVFVMSQHDPEEVEDLIIEVARTDPDPEVQEAAVFWLSQVGTEGALDALAAILETTDEPGLQENAIFALAQHRSQRAGQVLRSYALDASKPDRVREKAIFWLSQHPDHADGDLLIDLYGQLDSPGLKEHLFMALSQLHDERAIEWILERALDDSEDIELRKQALFWAGQHGSIELDRFAGMYARMTDREMKQQLIYLYGQRGEDAAIDELIEIVRSEEDVELRKNAIFWLGQTGDERAIAFLLELVGDPR